MGINSAWTEKGSYHYNYGGKAGGDYGWEIFSGSARKPSFIRQQVFRHNSSHQHSILAAPENTLLLW